MVGIVSDELVSSYGVVDLQGQEIQPGNSKAMEAIVKKSKVDKAPSNLPVVGRYVLNENIWSLLKETAPGAGGGN